jgi:hypothetical protein
MKACIETGNLGHIRQPFEDRFNGCEIVRLVQRGERIERMQLGENLRRDSCWGTVFHAAVNDTMSDAKNPGAAIFGSEPLGESLERAALIPHRRIERLIDKDSTVDIAGRNSRAGADALDLTSRCEAPVLARRPHEDAKLQTR